MWIEIELIYGSDEEDKQVTPLAGVWIEISKVVGSFSKGDVTPLAGVWIEITITNAKISDATVTPLAGVWIEIPSTLLNCSQETSLPLRECGLKFTRKQKEDR